MNLTAIMLGTTRFHEQVTTGEWSGAAQRDWLSFQWPCGRTRCDACDPERSGRARRAVVWSQVMGAR